MRTRTEHILKLMELPRGQHESCVVDDQTKSTSGKTGIDSQRMIRP